MTSEEKLMCEIIAKISENNAPIVFKGALITKLILVEHGFDELQRITTDIDSNWVGDPPTMEFLESTLNDSLGSLRRDYAIVATRTYAEKKSAGFNVVNNVTGAVICKLDMSVMPVVGNKIYHFADFLIKGVLPNEILADKITVMSSDYIFRRMKDMIDVYALSNCISVKSNDIFDVVRKKRRIMQEFHGFYTRKQDLEVAYNKLKRITGKPNFSDIYGYIEKFIKPFAEKTKQNLTWNAKIKTWSAEPIQRSDSDRLPTKNKSKSHER
ncbi:MAG: nucleotidyl transferase AbiEii/AbiGii toxin family protein [Turicibacter sp.]|nr:nucleotidyl transferase AbiEii/AbiGii toxin family protein [Turicibacter sp.]